MSHYGTIEEANDFFASRLHNWDWDNADADTRVRALNQATELIDQFDFIDQKADESQDLEFPRTGQSDVPRPIKRACFLIAQDMIGGRDPGADFENLALRTEVFAGLRAEHDRNGNPQEHLNNLIPNVQAWNLIRPWLRIVKSFTWNRV
jgi:hypothetical protein